ncbi:hypothetical protein HMPREF1985_00967 [Mitsuokella sp. oral taxon 131 str. W9106]|nr:hypothetical protein HMPREF1985_00967 [Mitsuokella sp. oral taxon 131 str. W9106]
MTTKAVKKSFFWNDRKRWRILLMKRTASPITISLTLQRYISLYELQKIRSLTDLFDKFV